MTANPLRPSTQLHPDGLADGNVLGLVGTTYGPAQAVKPVGLTGATQATRYVGATTSGAPVSGTFAVGDWIIAQNAHVWICTAAGSPGTWADAGSGVSPSATVVSETAFGQAAAAGTAAAYSRGDHTHGTPAAPSVPSAASSVTNETFGVAAVVGTSTNYARQDHVHGMPAESVTSVAGRTGAVTLTESDVAGLSTDLANLMVLDWMAV